MQLTALDLTMYLKLEYLAGSQVNQVKNIGMQLSML